LPWSATTDAWAILVSEIMLQQTQVSRVIPAWTAFLDAFPTPRACAEATTGDVLRRWEGMGYHRRAVNLQRAAQVIVRDHEGRVPGTVPELVSLPGVGDYTARAVASFAFGEPVGVLDTNVGRVLARAVVGAPLVKRDAQAWADAIAGTADSAVLNQALLDLGAQFCSAVPKCAVCPVRRSCRWRGEGDDPAPRSAAVSRPQSRFVGSRRQRRGQLLAALRAGSLTTSTARTLVGADAPTILDAFVREGLAVKRGQRYQLA
jgi:A/G-specific adenine glycosylase